MDSTNPKGFVTPSSLGLLTDLYELTMAAAYLKHGITEDCTFEVFCRRLPPNRSFLITAGLEQAVEYLQGIRFSADQIEYLRQLPLFASVDDSFFRYLTGFEFRGDLWAMPEGTPFFPQEPILRVKAPAPDAQILETYLLSILSYQTMVASKAARLALAAAGKPVIDFGTRRAHGPQAGLLAARACFIGGCLGTSNVLAGQQWGIPVFGTMAHSWVMQFDSEEAAFESFRRIFPKHTVMLLDTYDTLQAAQLVDSELEAVVVLIEQPLDLYEVILLERSHEFFDVVPQLGLELPGAVRQRHGHVGFAGLLQFDLFGRYHERGSNVLVFV